MSIKLKVDSYFLGNDGSSFIGVEVDGNTVGECLNQLMEQKPTIKKAIFDKKGNLSPATFVTVNRKGVFSDKLAKSVNDGDEISIISVTRGCCD